MSYKLRFHELALSEWRKLDGSVKIPLKKKLAERLVHPRVPSAAMSDTSEVSGYAMRPLTRPTAGAWERSNAVHLNLPTNTEI